jgi:DeoR/GlpR family transcriptional regulator of sugar metabolism
MNGLTSRQNDILELMRSGEEPSVARLSSVLDVSVVTIRADLKSLEEKGYVVRTRGGALPAFHPDMLEKKASRTAEKERIAKAAAALIGDGEHLMITNGTTSALVARYLLGRRGLQVVTNSTLLLPYARVNPNFSLTLIGGEFRPSAEALVGPDAVSRLDQFHVALTISGTDGFTLENGLTTHLVENAEIVRKMCAQADRTIIVADSSKYGRRGFIKILPIERIDMIITDTGLPEEAAQAIRERGVEVLRVQA